MVDDHYYCAKLLSGSWYDIRRFLENFPAPLPPGQTALDYARQLFVSWTMLANVFDGSPAPGNDPIDYRLIGIALLTIDDATNFGGDGIAQLIEAVDAIGDGWVHLTLDRALDPGAWTCFRHLFSGAQACFGYLPGDVNGDGATTSPDILALVDSLNGVVLRPLHSTDIDRSGAMTPADVLREIDLLNGASAFEPWNNRSLPDLP